MIKTKTLDACNSRKVASAIILYVFHQDVPDGDDVADASCQDEEVEDGVHVSLLVDAVEDGTRDIAYALGDNPNHRGWGHGVVKRFEGDQYRQAHAHKAKRLQVAVVLQFGETHHGANNGTRPDEDEEAPSPVALVAQGNQSDRRVGTGDVPVDGGMVPLAQSLLPLAPSREGMVGGGGDIRHEHAEEVEDDACRCPTVMLREAPIQEDDAEDDTQQDATGM